MDRKAMMKLSEVNALSAKVFEAAFADVAEHSPWVAQAAALKRPFATREAMIAAFVNAVTMASRAQKLSLIRAHPDLAAKAKLTSHSSREQSGAGLDRLTKSELETFTALNNSYKTKFGFPFIFAVKGATKTQILGAFIDRLVSSHEAEFLHALAQVARILRFRIEERVLP